MLHRLALAGIEACEKIHGSFILARVYNTLILKHLYMALPIGLPSLPPKGGIEWYVPVRYFLFPMTGYSPDAPGAIQAKLAYLRLRKAALDDLIVSLERYSVYQLPPARKVLAERPKRVTLRRLAGAA